MKKLFTDQKEIYTPEAVEICKEVRKFLDPIIITAIEENISLRDLELILHQEVSMLLAEKVLRRNLEIIKSERKNK